QLSRLGSNSDRPNPGPSLTPPRSRAGGTPGRGTLPPARLSHGPCCRVGGWRGSRFVPGFFSLSVCFGSDGQPATRPFPSAPLRTGLATSTAHGSPVPQAFNAREFALVSRREAHGLG